MIALYSQVAGAVIIWYLSLGDCGDRDDYFHLPIYSFGGWLFGLA